MAEKQLLGNQTAARAGKRRDKHVETDGKNGADWSSTLHISTHMAKIINEYPPNIAEIEKHFDITGRTVYFTYGDTIYHPSGGHLEPSYVFHEEVHMKQQRDIGGPEIWWDKYIKDPAFRIEQEVDAYGQQLRYIRRNNAKKVGRELNHFAEVLSSALYGNMMTEEDARRQVWDRSMRP